MTRGHSLAGDGWGQFVIVFSLMGGDHRTRPLPRCASSHYPRNAFQDVARIAPLAPAAIEPGARVERERGDAPPVGVGEGNRTSQRADNPLVSCLTINPEAHIPLRRQLLASTRTSLVLFPDHAAHVVRVAVDYSDNLLAHIRHAVIGNGAQEPFVAPRLIVQDS